MSVTYWHGGPSGLSEILPPSATGAVSCSDVGLKKLRAKARRVHRTDRVYVVAQREGALIFAAGHRTASIYEVLPVGELEPDPDCDLPGLSFACASARVVRETPIDASTLSAVRRALWGIP